MGVTQSKDPSMLSVKDVRFTPCGHVLPAPQREPETRRCSLAANELNMLCTLTVSRLPLPSAQTRKPGEGPRLLQECASAPTVNHRLLATPGLCLTRQHLLQNRSVQIAFSLLPFHNLFTPNLLSYAPQRSAAGLQVILRHTTP